MDQAVNVSVVMPVHDGQDRITARVAQVFTTLYDLDGSFEVVVVDDGSRDGTPEVLHRLCAHHAQLKIVRHHRPRGMEAAGRTGMERASGNLIIVQETDAELRADDLRRLLRISSDLSVVAARAESSPRPLSQTLLESLRHWSPSKPLTVRLDAPAASGLQMIRRPHLRLLSGPDAQHYRLHGQTLHVSSVDRFNPSVPLPRPAESTAPPPAPAQA